MERTDGLRQCVLPELPVPVGSVDADPVPVVVLELPPALPPDAEPRLDVDVPAEEEVPREERLPALSEAP